VVKVVYCSHLKQTRPMASMSSPPRPLWSLVVWAHLWLRPVPDSRPRSCIADQPGPPSVAPCPGSLAPWLRANVQRAPSFRLHRPLLGRALALGSPSLQTAPVDPHSRRHRRDRGHALRLRRRHSTAWLRPF
jgi:hypothetical protein